MHPLAQKEMELAGIDDAYTQFVNSFTARYTNLKIVDGRHAKRESSWFIDAAHFHRAGAIPYSATVAQVLKEEHDSQWIILPEIDNLSDSQLEDVQQSADWIKKSHLSLN